MSSLSTSSFLMKFQQVQGNYENLIKLFEAPAVISEDEGYEAFQVNFLLYSREPDTRQNKRGSCFELLRRLVKNSNTAMPVNKDTLVTILSRNPRLLEELKQKSAIESDYLPEFDGSERELVIAAENSFFRIPTFDFAMVRQNECIYICTALENESGMPERIFLKLTNFPEVFEGVLRNFMRKPEEPKLNSLSLPILPSIDTNSLLIQPSTIFEDFIEYSDDLQDENQPHQFNYDNSEPSKVLSNSQSQSKSATKSNSISPKKPKKSEHPSSKSSPNVGNRQCLNCFCTSTPMWRRGPDGVASLCNACGVKFKAGKLQMSPELVELNKRKIQENQQIATSQQNQDAFLAQNEEITLIQY